MDDEYSGNDFGQQESRDGDNTIGSYYVLLPDGRLMTVTYQVNGDSGFLAEVSYEGEAQYPEPSSPSASYQQPEPPAPSYQQPAPPAPTYQQPRAPPAAPSRGYQRPSQNAALFPPSNPIYG